MASENTTQSNLIPESGIRFCIVKSKGVVIRHPIKPLPRIRVVVLAVACITMQYKLEHLEIGYIWEGDRYYRYPYKYPIMTPYFRDSSRTP